MKQVLQHLRTGELELAEVPAPVVRPGAVLIRTRASLISPGTERMLVEFSQASLLQKARQQPERVQQVLDKIRADGFLPTLEAVFRKLDEPLPLGYCNAGVVMEVGPGVHDLRPGDRVASNGPHAEFVCVPRHLCARVPDGVTDEQAAFTALGSVALQGLRLAAPELGEKFVVFGLGVVGLLTVQLLRAHGCQVMGVDLLPGRLKLAETLGAATVDASRADPIAAAAAWTGEKGADGAIIAASAETDEIVHQAAAVCRQRGRIVLVGVVGLNLRRRDFYEKELTFQVSCSYGPGRYDEKYEQAGRDYPRGFVRWTEQRNFEGVLEAMQAGRLRVDALVTDRLPLGEAADAYRKLRAGPSALGIVLRYPEQADARPSVTLRPEIASAAAAAGEPAVGVIGAGSFARSILLPALARTPARLLFVADLNGAAAQHAARRFGAARAVTDYRVILSDPAVRAVFILTGHDSHAGLVCEALRAGKHVYVEKPLALGEEQLAAVAQAYDERAAAGGSPLLMVGFNRRFSPHVARVKDALAGRREPLCMTATVNAGSLPAAHWARDPERGGGRIVGEACHLIDLLSHLAGSPVATVFAAMAGKGDAAREDAVTITLGFADGSIGTVHYFANGSRIYPKERLDVFSEGRVLAIENFRATRGYGARGFRALRTWRQDKGHRAEIAAFVARVASGGPPLIPFPSLLNVTRASFAAVESARTGVMVML